MASTAGTVSLFRRLAAATIAVTPTRALATGLLALGLSAMEGLGLLLLVPLLALVGVGEPGPGALGGIAAQVDRVFEWVGLQPTLAGVLALYVGAIALQSLIARRQALLTALVQQDVVTHLRDRLYRALSAMDWSAFVRGRASDYTQLLSGDVDRVGMAVIGAIELSVLGVTSLVYIAVAFSVSPFMTIAVLAAAALLALVLRGRVDHSRRLGERASTAWTAFHGALSEHLASLKIAKSYGALSRHAEAFGRAAGEVRDVGVSSVRAYARVRQDLSIGSAILLAAIVYVAYTVLAVSTVQLLLLLFLFARLVPRVTSMYERLQLLAGALPAYAAVIDAERRCAAQAEAPAAAALPIGLAHAVTFEGVSFNYGEGAEGPAAVREATFAIPARRTTAIVGPSGAGKSTVADLLLGLLQPSDGRILIDDVPLGPDRLESWRAAIGYVPQDTFLFHDTIRANLLWARPGAAEDDLWRALHLASAGQFVSALPQGLDAVVGDRGIRVSGGERQRISLARALLRAPSLLILDEATSALDSENEARIQGAVDTLHHQLTIVVITHRLSTIRSADLIHVMDGGRVVESGGWEALIAQPGRFRALCQAQGIDERPLTLTRQ